MLKKLLNLNNSNFINLLTYLNSLINNILIVYLIKYTKSVYFNINIYKDIYKTNTYLI